MAINENLDVRQGGTQSLGLRGEGAHSSSYLIIIASFSALVFLAADSHAGLKCHETGVLR